MKLLPGDQHCCDKCSTPQQPRRAVCVPGGREAFAYSVLEMGAHAVLAVFCIRASCSAGLRILLCRGRLCKPQAGMQGGKKRAEELGSEGYSEMGKKGATASPATGMGGRE